MKPRRKRLLAGLAGALVVNLLLFGLLPVLVGTQSSGTDLEDITAVQLVDVTPPAPPPEKEETPEPPKPPEPPKIMPAMTMPRKPVDVPRMDLQLPDLNFEINPQLAAGMSLVRSEEEVGRSVRSSDGARRDAVGDCARLCSPPDSAALHPRPSQLRGDGRGMAALQPRLQTRVEIGRAHV